MSTKLLEIISVDFDIVEELMSDILHLSNTDRGMGVQWDIHIGYFINFKESVSRL
jgi:hypothetical protein